MAEVHFDKYYVHDVERMSSLRKRAGRAYRRLKARLIQDGLMYPYGLYKHQALLKSCERTQSHTYTCFLRSPSQLRTICGPVMDFLGNPERTQRKLEVLLFACSNGAEVYTLASWLMTHLPGLDFHITASDLHEEMVEYARAAEYAPGEALHSDYVTRSFVEATFIRTGDRYVVRPEIRAKASFHQANLLDAEALARRFQKTEMVVAQNVLFHLDPELAERAFDNLVAMLRPRAVLLVEGMDQSLRIKVTRRHGLTPLTANSRRIYNETRVHTPVRWWEFYWGSEPYAVWRSSRHRRYGTIFLNDKQSR